MKKIKLKRPQQKKDKAYHDHLLIEEKEKQEPKTKLEAILFSRNLKQGDLRRMILNNSGFMLGRDRISKICTGRMIKYNLKYHLKLNYISHMNSILFSNNFLILY